MDRELTLDEAEAAGFDGTGRDGDPRFPFHVSDLIDYPILTHMLVEDIGEALEDEHGEMPDRFTLELAYGARIGGNLAELIEIARTGRSAGAEMIAEYAVMQAATELIMRPPAPTMADQKRLTDKLFDQRAWIASHGGDEEGYIIRYGNSNWPVDMRLGDGGQAIYAADKAELDRFEAELDGFRG